ncbi:hypothetical protein MM239_00495 [Belliella sp. DSM 111904]|uniref:Uncharacterized protein n=1 Tax=Belliella filtrata TaxID=2923435 RepID=A0ABS9UVN2_9BACT|nr:hypothetical protein [Belliella filtrata]MCH7407858.1 hypothetical protein [Belliella filtrata]
MRKMIFILTFIASILFIVTYPGILNYFGDQKWYKKYKYLHEIEQIEGYKIIRMTDKRLEEFLESYFYSQEENDTFLNDTGVYRSDLRSEVLYHATKGTFWIKILDEVDDMEYPVDQTSEDAYTSMKKTVYEWIEFDYSGSIVSKDSINFNLQESDFQIIKPPYPFFDIRDLSPDLYLKHFAKEKFIWSWFLPNFNPTGYGPPKWKGKAYLTIELEKGALTYKKNANDYGDNNFKFEISYYKIPRELTGGKEVVLVYQGEGFARNNKESQGFYVIVEK